MFLWSSTKQSDVRFFSVFAYICSFSYASPILTQTLHLIKGFTCDLDALIY